MGQENSFGLRSDVTDILIANGLFYRKSADDEALYLIDLAAIGALAYQIIEFAANVFGAALPLIAGGRWAYKRYFPGEEGAPADSAGVGKDATIQSMSQSELKASLERLKSNAQDPDLRIKLSEDLKRILEYHGWPATEADVDAKRIVTTLVDGGNP